MVKVWFASYKEVEELRDFLSKYRSKSKNINRIRLCGGVLRRLESALNGRKQNGKKPTRKATTPAERGKKAESVVHSA